MHDEALLAYHDCLGDDRRIHALVIGVGRYQDPAPRYGQRLESLPGAALAGYRFAHYLVNEFQHQEPQGRKLATLRLMLSPLDRERPEVAPLKYGPAERKEVAVALQDWADDCNGDERNLAVLYVVGHGVALGRGSSLLLLADAPGERSLAMAAVNLALTEDLMVDCAAQTNLFFYDCCAVGAESVPGNHGAALTISEFPPRGEGMKRAGILCINAARVGSKTFAIGSEGTLLSRSLLGDYQNRAGDDALLRIAGEIWQDEGFGVSASRIRALLSQCLKRIAVSRNVPADGYEAIISGKWEPRPITLPRPVPEFQVALRGLRSGRTMPVGVCLVGQSGARTQLTSDADDLEVWRVPAGDYGLEITDASANRPDFRLLQVTGPVEQSVDAFS